MRVYVLVMKFFPTISNDKVTKIYENYFLFDNISHEIN